MSQKDIGAPRHTILYQIGTCSSFVSSFSLYLFIVLLFHLILHRRLHILPILVVSILHTSSFSSTIIIIHRSPCPPSSSSSSSLLFFSFLLISLKVFSFKEHFSLHLIFHTIIPSLPFFNLFFLSSVFLPPVFVPS